MIVMARGIVYVGWGRGGCKQYSACFLTVPSFIGSYIIMFTVSIIHD